MSRTSINHGHRTKRITIKGRVQGVWFRDSTRREAESTGITGYAKNLANGDVEVMASGTDDALNKLQLWLKDGPPLARVDELIVQQVDYEGFNAFEIR